MVKDMHVQKRKPLGKPGFLFLVMPAAYGCILPSSVMPDIRPRASIFVFFGWIPATNLEG